MYSTARNSKSTSILTNTVNIICFVSQGLQLRSVSFSCFNENTFILGAVHYFYSDIFISINIRLRVKRVDFELYKNGYTKTSVKYKFNNRDCMQVPSGYQKVRRAGRRDFPNGRLVRTQKHTAGDPMPVCPRSYREYSGY